CPAAAIPYTGNQTPMGAREGRLDTMIATDKVEQLIIGGERVGAASGQTFQSIDPSTGEVLAVIARAGAADVDRAVAAARAAFEGKEWSEMAPAQRGRLMLKMAALIREHAEYLARLESMDNG